MIAPAILSPASISLLTICGLEELGEHSTRRVTHVLSILDPEWPDPETFRAYERHHRTVLRFHDAIEACPGIVLPERSDVDAVLAFGAELADAGEAEGHLLVHCHAGISRSTAAMAMLIAQARPEASDEDIFCRLLEIRPKAWPNSRMIGFADERLERGGAMSAALGRLYARQLESRPEIGDFMRVNGRGREVEMAKASA
jgi:predicted protein tyrosine phosphatase